MNNLGEISAESIRLFKQVKADFAESGKDAVRELVSRIPEQFLDSNKKVNIVFAGQYSAGKSSILSIMTGKKLAVGGGITTQQCQSFDWNGITVIDTPGIHTQNRPDHDEITYHAIADADLIVFVITSEGFSDHLGKHFRKLLIEKGKGHEMMLLVNKMGAMAQGNTSEAQEILKEKDILPVISPEYSCEELYTSFVDAKSYIDSAVLPLEFRKKKIKDSGIENFYNNFDSFVHERRLLGRYTTPLYKLEQILVDAIATFESNDSTADAAKSILIQNRRLLVESRDRVTNRGYHIIREKTAQVRMWGEDIANDLDSSKKQEQVNSQIRTKSEETNFVYSAAATEFTAFVDEEIVRLKEQADILFNSQFVTRLKETISNMNVKIDEKPSGKYSKAGEATKDFGNWLAKMSAGKEGGSFLKLSTFSNSKTHDAVIKVGHFFNKKFVPWEAVKTTQRIGQAGKALGWAGAIFGVGLQIYSDMKEDEIEEQLSDARANIRNHFTDAARILDLEFDKDTNKWIEESYGNSIEKCDKQIAEIEEIVHTQEEEYKKYQGYLKQVRALIRRIQSDI